MLLLFSLLDLNFQSCLSACIVCCVLHSDSNNKMMLHVIYKIC